MDRISGPREAAPGKRSAGKTASFAQARVGRARSGRPSALTHGFHVAFYVLTALVAASAVVAALLIEKRPTAPQEEELEVAWGLAA